MLIFGLLRQVSLLILSKTFFLREVEFILDCKYVAEYARLLPPNYVD